MTNIISFEELIGVQPTVHCFDINGRVILYTSPTLATRAAMRKLEEQRKGSDDLTLGNVATFASDVLKAQRYEDGQETTNEWIEGVAFGDFLHFQQFIGNPAAPGEKPESASPLNLKGFRGYDILLPPVTLGDYKAFAAYLEPGNRSGDDFLLEQIGAAFDKATQADGSPLPDNLLQGLTEQEASALVNFWMNRQKTDAGNVEATPKRGGKAKRASGAK